MEMIDHIEPIIFNIDVTQNEYRILHRLGFLQKVQYLNLYFVK